MTINKYIAFMELPDHSVDFIPLKSKNVVDAIAEVESLDLYASTITVMEVNKKMSGAVSNNGVVYGWYNSAMFSTGNGWNVTNAAHGQSKFSIEVAFNPNGRNWISAI